MVNVVVVVVAMNGKLKMSIPKNPLNSNDVDGNTVVWMVDKEINIPVVCVRCWKDFSECECINIEDYEE